MDIETLAPVLFQNELLTPPDMEQLQLPIMTESKKKDYVYLKMMRLGEEEYKKFLSCLKHPFAMQHPGHLKLYEKLHQWMLIILATWCVAAISVYNKHVLPYSYYKDPHGTADTCTCSVFIT